jgi:hypothetical protein
MQYMLLIYTDEQAWAALPDDERKAIVREYYSLADELSAQGRYKGGAPLHPTSTATTVRVRNDEQVVTDGPYAETKEQLGGFFLIEADSVEQAQAVGSRIPAARYGTIEVRAVAPVPAEVSAG